MGGDEAKANARENLCRFLAACYYQPETEFAEERLFDSMQAAAALIDAELAASAQRIGASFVREGRENLLLDYTRLFLGPMGAVANPYGSVWLEGEDSLMRDSSLEVLDLYREGGFELAEDFRELPDHIAVELEFLYLLIFRENQAARVKDTELPQDFASIRRRFLDRHLGKWIGPFAAAVESGAGSAFYRELASLTERFVRMESTTGKDNP